VTGRPFDAALVVAFGGAEGMGDVRRFLANVLRGPRCARHHRAQARANADTSAQLPVISTSRNGIEPMRSTVADRPTSLARQASHLQQQAVSET
jgi:hypothetical protein